MGAALLNMGVLLIVAGLLAGGLYIALPHIEDYFSGSVPTEGRSLILTAAILAFAFGVASLALSWLARRLRL